jgi:uncharacterized protein
MARFPNPYNRGQPYAPGQPYGPGQPIGLDYAGPEQGAIIARFFNAVYAWMAAGLALTAIVAWYVATHYQSIFAAIGIGGLIGLFVVQLILVFTISAAIQRISAPVATVLFLVYAALNGVTLSGIVLYYTHAAIASAFVVTAGMFAAMSLYGFVTRRDLTAWGSLLFMGLIGLILASVVSLFWHNTLLQVGINYLGVLIFVGLTAYDTQRLKVIALQTAGAPQLAARLAVSGALSLYLDFLNLFLFVLELMSDRRR